MLKAPKIEGQKHAARIEYKDSLRTDHMRRQMATINSWLAEADISYGERSSIGMGRPVD